VPCTLIFCNCAGLFPFRFLQVFDSCLDFPQQHFGNVACSGSQSGYSINGVEIHNALKILKAEKIIGWIAAAD
jgi:hypothetical protein